MDTFQLLLLKYIQGKITVDEQQELEQWVAASEENKLLFEKLCSTNYLARQMKKMAAYDENKAWQRIQAQTKIPILSPKPHKYTHKKIFFIKRLAVAAAVVGLIVTSFLYLQHSANFTKKTHRLADADSSNKTKASGSNATLTLADGSVINLNETNNGLITKQNGAMVTKSNGLLLYNNSTMGNGSVTYNTLTTPRGGAFEVVLPDGTHAWLNAESSLRFPTAFNSSVREVQLDGEGYFEVAKNVAQPFTVKAKQVNVYVLGTHFNVMAYNEEKAVKTTLLEGMVKVENNNTNVVITPGQQASLDNGSNTFRISNPDLEEIMAWKDNEFKFNKVGINAILRQVARWYDVDVIYKDKIPDKPFTGNFSRRKDIAELLNILEESGTLHFAIEGRKVYVFAGSKK